MNIERSKTLLRIVTISVIVFSIIFLVGFLYLLTQPQIVPPSETYGSFWIKNFSILIAAFAFASSALAAANNAIEQRLLRYMENYPYLEIFPILSVDPLPSPIPKADLPEELSDFNTKYLKTVAPAQQIKASDSDFRYLALALRNVGHGYITKVFIEGMAEVPSRGLGPTKFSVKRRFNLSPSQIIPFTLLPIAGLPEYKVQITSLEYYGHFVKLNEFDGQTVYHDSFPFTVPPERRVVIFLDDFQNIPIGLNWVLDFWGTWQPSENIYIPAPSGNDHYLVLKGSQSQYKQHFNKQGGVYKDLLEHLEYGQTVQVTARVRATPGTTAGIQLWCHDIASNPKNRYSDLVTPSADWQNISMLFTSTQTPNLRVHLLYTPGIGQILVDKVVVELLHT